MPKPKLQLCREVSTRDEHAPDCPHWEAVDASTSVLQARVAKLEAALGGPVEGIDWSWEVNAMRIALEKP